MAYKARLVEGAALAALVLALALPAWGQQAPDAVVPDGVDYIMAVQCAGLTRAVAAYEDYVGSSAPARDRSERFTLWAEIRASESGKDKTQARRDVEASWQDFRKLAGKGTGETRLKRLRDAHGGDIKACDSLSGVSDFVIVGG